MNKKFHLHNILLIGAIILSIIFISFIPAFGEKLTPVFFSSSISTAALAALIGILVSFFFYESRFANSKFSKVFAIGALILTIENLIVVLLQPNEYWINTIIRYTHDIGGDYRAIEIFTQSHYEEIPTFLIENESYRILVNLGSEYKWFAIASLPAEIIAIYLGLFVLPRKLASKKSLIYLIFAVFIVGAISMIYSYIAEWDKYVYFFQNFKSEESNCIESFTGQHNVYGMLLVFVIFFALLFHSINKKWWNFLIVGFTFINLIFSTSKGSLICAIVLIVGYLISRFAITYKEHKKRNLIFLAGTIGILLVVSLMAVVAAATRGKVFSFIIKAGADLMNITTSSTIVARKHIWQNTIQLLNENNGWIFGRGFNLLLRMLYPMNTLNGDPVIVPHNGFLRLIGFGGILMVIAFVILLAYLVKIAIKNMKENKSISWLCLIGAFSFLLYSLIETNHLIMLFMFLPILILDYEKKEQNHTYPIPYNETKERKFSLSSNFISYIFVPITCVVIGIISPLLLTNNIVLVYIAIYLVLTLIIPLIFELILKKKTFNFKMFIKDNFINFISILISSIVISLYIFLFKENNVTKGLVIGTVFAFISLIPYCLSIKLIKPLVSSKNLLVNVDKSIDKFLNKFF